MNQETIYQTGAQPPQTDPPQKKSGLLRFLALILAIALAVTLGPELMGGSKSGGVISRKPKFIAPSVDDWLGVWAVEGTGYGVIITGDGKSSMDSLPFRTDGAPFRDQIPKFPVLYMDADGPEPHLFLTDGDKRAQTIYATQVNENSIVALSAGKLFTDTEAYHPEDRKELVFRKLYSLPATSYNEDLAGTDFIRLVQEDTAALLEQLMESSGYDFALDPTPPDLVVRLLPAQICGSLGMNVAAGGAAHFGGTLDFELCYGENGLRPVNLSFRAPGLDRVVLYADGTAVY